MASDLPHAVVPETPNPLNRSSLDELNDLLRSLTDMEGMLAYRQVVSFVGQHMLGMNS